jgi:hypothetical protein
VRKTIFALLSLLLIASQRKSQTNPNPFNGFTATAWPQADRLFHSNPLWLGGDAAYSVDLGSGRVLWLFGDSFIATAPDATRRQSTFVHNSIAIENGYDPAQASMAFYWPMKDGKPTEFAPNEGSVWLWPDDGIRIGNRLLLFFSRVHSDKSMNSLGFRSAGWTAFIVDNPDSKPSSWILHRVNAQPNKFHIHLGEGVERLGDFVYAFGSPEGPRPGDYLARWPLRAAEAGNLSSPEWWCGAKNGWLAQERMHKQAPAVALPNASSEFAIQWRPRLQKFIEVESVGFGASDIAVRWADRLEGPWSKPMKIYHPPESNRPDAFVYAGKLHPGLLGANVVITYAANSSSDGILAKDMSIYFPRFVRLNFAKP